MTPFLGYVGPPTGQRQQCVKCGYCTARLESLKLESHRSVPQRRGGPPRRCTDCRENETNQVFDISVIPKNILVFFNCRTLVVFPHSWCFYPISVPTFCEEKCFHIAGGVLQLTAMADWRKFGI